MLSIACNGHFRAEAIEGDGLEATCLELRGRLQDIIEHRVQKPCGRNRPSVCSFG
jgi:hypothetical protein